MHLPELDIQLPAFRLDVCMPGESFGPDGGQDI
jgi:hypothetical protein